MPVTVETPGVLRDHIVQTPGTCGGKPRIAGHRIKVQPVVVWHERTGLNADAIVAQYPQLTFAEVYSALAYYWDHKAQIDADIRADEAFVAASAGQSHRLRPKGQAFDWRNRAVLGFDLGSSRTGTDEGSDRMDVT